MTKKAKLSLNQETLRELTKPQLERVVGGATAFSCCRCTRVNTCLCVEPAKND